MALSEHETAIHGLIITRKNQIMALDRMIEAGILTDAELDRAICLQRLLREEVRINSETLSGKLPRAAL
jgi:hypothetical protein